MSSGRLSVDVGGRGVGARGSGHPPSRSRDIS